jgi:hypothetical protein
MTLVDRSPDLSRLVKEGYDLEIRDGNLLVHHVPYVTCEGRVDYCILVSELTHNGTTTVAPGDHRVWVVGEVPHDHLANRVKIVLDDPHNYGEGLQASCSMSGKPGGGMPRDYHHKISNYVMNVLGPYVREIDPSATHTDYPPRESSAEESVFRYHDAATSRAGLSAISEKLKLSKVAIVGLGGTGSYILDLIAKTPISEIHLYDDDVLYAHNAFRAPGAASLTELEASPLKVTYYAEMYDNMRRGIDAHPVCITDENVDELQAMNFVFLSMDSGPMKRTIVESLQGWGIPFVDCGMGVRRQDDSLCGTLRVTVGSEGRYGHLSRRISYTDVNANEYDWNIQTADLNMLNAAMAVLKWKKLVGYYADSKNEFNTTYNIARNQLISGEYES